ncbi:hypothetical protein CY35_16G018300 [Sphagnum magellanicum]|nr:hypothetical protein CY35_16G018300 [Sphagnum magellanicum]
MWWCVASAEMSFETDLSNDDRAMVHDLCKKMGLKSKSHGKGNQRYITVSKVVKQHSKDESSLTTLSFSTATQEVLIEHFTHFPPTDEEVVSKGTVSGGASIQRISTPGTAPGGKGNVQNGGGPKTSSTGVSDNGTMQAAILAAQLQKMPGLQQVLIIAGETGCGKTTQVPQYILDHMWNTGKPCKIICTQPRRLSATSVAERVAAERGEQVGKTVGYQIRLESKGDKHSSLMFCTNGVLLRKLVGSGGRSLVLDHGTAPNGNIIEESTTIQATHIIVDEIHERDRNADFLLVVLRDLLPFRPDLHVILMSATLDSALFSHYFNDCPVIQVPGFTYPVQSFYLEDVLSLVEETQPSSIGAESLGRGMPLSNEYAEAMDEALTQAWLEDDFETLIDIVKEFPSLHLCNYQHSLTGATPLMVAAGKGRVDDVSYLLSLGADTSIEARNGDTALDWAQNNGHANVVVAIETHRLQEQSQVAAAEAVLLQKYLYSVDQVGVDVELIERLLYKICSSSEGFESASTGAVLVFLPGWEDITRARDCLDASPLFGNPSKFLLLPLHSMVPLSEQRKVFQRPPKGVRKIVLATNIAETAMTIDDVVFVIDSGRVKEKSYDPYSNVSTLQTAWVSKASAKQREGRAGRCQPGVCYHLFSKVRLESLSDFSTPEIKRTPLEELCLQVKLLEPHGRIVEFIRKAIDPPLDLAVQNAVMLLQDLGALTPDERLTELGRQLGSLPVHPSTSKMLLVAILLNCLDPALTVACAAGYREPFVLPMAPDQKKRASAARQELAEIYGGYSDHLAVVAAFDRWEAAKTNSQEKQFCSQYFISDGTMIMLAGMRQQLQGELAQKGFVPFGRHSCSLNARDPGIVRAVLAAGMYPMVGTLLPGGKPVVKTMTGQKVRIHLQSANFRLTQSCAPDGGMNGDLMKPLLVFDEITRGEAQVYIRNSTLVKPHALILMSSEMVVIPPGLEPENVPAGPVGAHPEDLIEDYDSGGEEKAKDRPSENPQVQQLVSAPDRTIAVIIDRWLHFKVTAVEAAQLYVLRERLASAFAFKVKHPHASLPPMLADAVYAIACLLSFDGALGEDTVPTKGKKTQQLDQRTWHQVGNTSQEYTRSNGGWGVPGVKAHSGNEGHTRYQRRSSHQYRLGGGNPPNQVSSSQGRPQVEQPPKTVTKRPRGGGAG